MMAFFFTIPINSRNAQEGDQAELHVDGHERQQGAEARGGQRGQES